MSLLSSSSSLSVPKSLSSALLPRPQSSWLQRLLLRGWRERWSEVQFGIQIKTLIPRGCSGDAYNLSEILLNHALLGPAPNALVLSYLRHSLGSQVVSHASVLSAVSKQEDWTKPFCIQALLQLVEEAKRHITAKGRPEDCIQLSVSLLHILSWLLKVFHHSLDGLENKKKGPEKQLTKNLKAALDLLRFMSEKEFFIALMSIGKAEDKESYSKCFSLYKQVIEQVKQCASKDGQAAKTDLVKVAHALQSIDALKIPIDTFKGASPTSPELLIQPLIAFEVVLNPTADLVVLSQQIYTVAVSQGMQFSEVVFQILRGSLDSLSDTTVSFDSCKWDAFLLIKLPSLLDKLAAVLRVDTAQLRTPTELYKAFDKLLKNEALLDSIDVKCNCNVIELLLSAIGKTSPPLMTSTERDDVLKKRVSGKAAGRMLDGKAMPKEILTYDDVTSADRDLKRIVMAEEKTHNMLKTLEMDGSTPATMESLLDVLGTVASPEGFDLLLAASAANGKLQSFIASILRFNEQSRESPGESVKNSLLRAALFDITFLMLVYMAQVLGSDLVLKEAKGTLMESWIRDLMLEECGRIKDVSKTTAIEMVDTLLQQLNSGDLRTQVVKWQNVVMNMHRATAEIFVASQEEAIDQDTLKKLLKTACTKLCALPVCVINWLLSHKSTGKRELEMFKEMAFTEAPHSPDTPSDAPQVPQSSARMALMRAVIKRMEASAGSDGSNDDSSKDKLLSVWKDITMAGRLDVDAVWALRNVLQIGGAEWLVSVLTEQMMKTVFQEDLDKHSDLLVAVFHLDLEACTLALLLNVAPTFLPSIVTGQMRGNNATVSGGGLTDPQGAALAKVIVSCIYSNLVPHQLSLKAGSKPGQKRGADDDHSGPGAKSRRLLDGEKSRIGGKSGTDSGSEESVHPVSAATSEFLRLLHIVVQEPSITPVTHFAIRLLEQACMRGGGPALVQTPHGKLAAQAGYLTRSHARLLLGHLNPSTVLHLAKLSPDSFPLAFVPHLFDVGMSGGGRKGAARVMCLLRNIIRKKEVMEEREKLRRESNIKKETT